MGQKLSIAPRRKFKLFAKMLRTLHVVCCLPLHSYLVLLAHQGFSHTWSSILNPPVISSIGPLSPQMFTLLAQSQSSEQSHLLREASSNRSIENRPLLVTITSPCLFLLEYLSQSVFTHLCICLFIVYSPL